MRKDTDEWYWYTWALFSLSSCCCSRRLSLFSCSFSTSFTQFDFLLAAIKTRETALLPFIGHASSLLKKNSFRESFLTLYLLSNRKALSHFQPSHNRTRAQTSMQWLAHSASSITLAAFYYETDKSFLHRDQNLLFSFSPSRPGNAKARITTLSYSRYAQ